MSDARPAVIQARDLILEVLMHRKNLTLTDAVCRDAAANAATALLPLLADLARGTAIAGELMNGRRNQGDIDE